MVNPRHVRGHHTPHHQSSEGTHAGPHNRAGVSQPVSLAAPQSNAWHHNRRRPGMKVVGNEGARQQKKAGKSSQQSRRPHNCIRSSPSTSFLGFGES
jgi:hypothetical protein